MAIDDDRILQAALAIAGAPGLAMDPDDLLEDAYLLAYAFPEEDDFMAATAATVRAIANLVGHRVTPAALKYDFAGWKSFHYQHRIAQGGRADCRIIFREVESGIEVKGFGHRRIPKDMYERMAEDRRPNESSQGDDADS